MGGKEQTKVLHYVYLIIINHIFKSRIFFDLITFFSLAAICTQPWHGTPGQKWKKGFGILQSVRYAGALETFFNLTGC